MEGFFLAPREGRSHEDGAVLLLRKKSSVLFGQGSRGRSEGLNKNMAVKYGGIHPLCKSED